jgi:hypothetical protein
MCQHCDPKVQIVEAESVADYLKRYYKPDRLASTGFEVLRRSYEIELEVYGFVVTSHYDSVAGGLIAWPHFEEWTDRMHSQVDRERELREKDPVINPSVSALGPKPKVFRQAKVNMAPAPVVDPFD